MKSAHFNDPVAAYDLLAAHYAGISRRRQPYLLSVEREIAARIPARSRSILDIGAGDGIRTARICTASAIRRVVLVEPSAEMRALGRSHSELDSRSDSAGKSAMEIRDVEASSGGAALVSPGRQPWVGGVTGRIPEGRHQASDESPHIEIWPFRAESLPAESASQRFDVITCLWNVLGHIAAENRGCTLRAVAQLLNQNGRFFIDVNHRYNLRAYGSLRTCARWVRDRLFPGESNGDVLANWNVGESSISTYGHVFTHREIVRLATAAGLELEERIVINYEDGRIQRFAFQGNLLYVFRRSSRIDSSSAPQTS